MKKMKFTIKLLAIIVAFLSVGVIKAQTLLYPTSSNGAWDYTPATGNPIAGVIDDVYFNDVYGGGVTKKISRTIGQTLDASWHAEFNFAVIRAVDNSSSTIDWGPAHVLLSLTENNNDPFGNNDAVMIIVRSVSTSTPNSLEIFAVSKDGTSSFSNSQTIALPITNHPYKVIVERFSDNYIRFALFDGITSNIIGSPVCFDINQNVSGLQYIQHAVVLQAGSARYLNAKVDGVQIFDNTIGSNLIGTNTTICNNSQYTLTNSQAPSSAFPLFDLNSVVYSWQYSTNPSNPSSWITIAGANQLNYTTLNLTQTTYFRRVVSLGCVIGNSNVVEVIVDQNCCQAGYDYSVSTGWNQTSTGVYVDAVNTQKVVFDNAADAVSRRVCKDISSDITLTNSFRANFEFTPTAVGTGGVGHVLMSLTAGDLDTYCSNSYVATNQDAIAVIYINNSFTNILPRIIKATAKDGDGNWYTPAEIIANDLNMTYYVTLERLDSEHGMLSVFSDAARTQHLPGSPQCFSLSKEVDNLKYLQHGTITWGGSGRKFTGTVDNVCINNLAPNGGIIGNDQTYYNPANPDPFVNINYPSLPGSNVINWTYEWEFFNTTTTLWETIPGANGADYDVPYYIYGKISYRRKATYNGCYSLYSNQVSVTILPQDNNPAKSAKFNNNETTSIETDIKYICYPNPFSDVTNIEYNLTENSNVTLEIYNMVGAKVATLVNGIQKSGNYVQTLSAEMLNNSKGVYFVKLIVNNETHNQKIIFTK